MPYSEKDGRVTLEMSKVEYERLLLVLGFACRNLHRSAPAFSSRFAAEVVNSIAAGNPNFTPYEIE